MWQLKVHHISQLRRSCCGCIYFHVQSVSCDQHELWGTITANNEIDLYNLKMSEIVNRSLRVGHTHTHRDKPMELHPVHKLIRPHSYCITRTPPHTHTHTVRHCLNHPWVWDRGSSAADERGGIAWRQRVIHGRRDAGWEGVKDRKGKSQMKSRVCTQTHTQRPSRLNEMDSLCEGPKAFKQTGERDISKEGRSQWPERRTGTQTDVSE